MSGAVRVGTRRSSLALRQTRIVIDALRRVAPERTFEVVPLVTSGDRHRGAAPDFTDRIDRALEGGEVDLAVHSAKDLPARPVAHVEIVAYPRRVDPRDCLVLRRGGGLDSLPRGSTIGSSSVRRRAQLLRARPDLVIVAIRGNVDTRLALVREGELDGAILALAGLARLGLKEAVSEVLDRRRFLPAPGQGALAVAARAGDRAMARLTSAVDHPSTRVAVTAERAFVTTIGGDCDTPLGATATLRGARLTLRAEILSADGRRSVQGARAGKAPDADKVGAELARDLLANGAGELLARRAGADQR